MVVTFLLLLLLPFALAFMILFPDDPDGRQGRFRRVLVAAASFVAADAVGAIVRPLIEGTEREEGFLPLSAILWLISCAILIVPFAISDRVAALLDGAVAAVAGVAAGLAWYKLLPHRDQTDEIARRFE